MGYTLWEKKGESTSVSFVYKRDSSNRFKYEEYIYHFGKYLKGLNIHVYLIDFGSGLEDLQVLDKPNDPITIYKLKDKTDFYSLKEVVGSSDSLFLINNMIEDHSELESIVNSSRIMVFPIMLDKSMTETTKGFNFLRLSYNHQIDKYNRWINNDLGIFETYNDLYCVMFSQYEKQPLKKIIEAGLRDYTELEANVFEETISMNFKENSDNLIKSFEVILSKIREIENKINLLYESDKSNISN